MYYQRLSELRSIFTLRLPYLKANGATKVGGNVTDNRGTDTNLQDRHDEASPSIPVLLFFEFQIIVGGSFIQFFTLPNSQTAKTKYTHLF